MTDQRLDAALAARGLARSRTHAAALIAEGLVTVDGAPSVKASARVRQTQRLEVAAPDHYVSRAAHKLLAALDGFSIDPAGRSALDVGASTGGFTQVLLERGASSVVALDVGHGQLAEPVRTDARVTVLEGVNARYLDSAGYAELVGSDARPSLVVGDLSFISLALVLPALLEVAELGADFVLLIKPQFEVGRGGIREGIVRSAALRDEAVMGVLWAAWDLGLGTAGILPSPIAGSAGNREYLAWLTAQGGSNPAEWSAAVSAIA
ncbi:TlyA family RNA methyltransferase [Antiquaquibacter oligotrophicus]|nr:TlyA family RNA methyltransferase [Antiquaquibacter oligotrophicus]UDF13543.1 TlyA family RNA methyltransferase [Antiquaquibacter oligotrophicus]